jgi:hypothetical protein
MAEEHVLLLIEYRDGVPVHEALHVEPLASDRYRLLFSPGLVLGIAAGDEFRLVGTDGAFEITRRGGNLSVILHAEEPVAGLVDELRRRVKRLGGRIDGQVEQSLVCSVPLAAGFPAVDALFEEWVSQHAGWVWYYGNVYDNETGQIPLNWWLDEPNPPPS